MSFQTRFDEVTPEFKQKVFDQVPPVCRANEPHMSILFLLDRSGSMGIRYHDGVPIDNLNRAMNRFKEEVCKDAKAAEIVDVAVVAFNGEAEVLLPFTPVALMDYTFNLTAEGDTNLAKAAAMGVEMTQERSAFYGRLGTQPYKPWIYLISDGYGGNVDEVARVISDLDAKDKLRFWSLGVEGYDSETLHKLSGKRVLKLNGHSFEGAIDWAAKSMRALSQRSPMESADLPPLPENVDKDVNDWQ